MKTKDLKAKYFTPETTSYKVVIEFYTEPNKGGNMSRYAFKGFKKGFVILSGVYDPNITLYTSLTNAIKAGQRISKTYKNCEVYICGVDYKGGKNFVKLNEIQ